MSRTSHPLERMVEPHSLEEVEVWEVPAGYGWRVLLQNRHGHYREQQGAIASNPIKDKSGWNNFWKQVRQSIDWYIVELDVQPIVDTLSQWAMQIVVDAKSVGDLYLLSQLVQPKTYAIMQNWTERELAAGQYLCKQRLY